MASLLGRVGTGTKENESSILSVWAAGFHHVTVRSPLARFFKLMNSQFTQRLKLFRVAVKRG